MHVDGLRLLCDRHGERKVYLDQDLVGVKDLEAI